MSLIDVIYLKFCIGQNIVVLTQINTLVSQFPYEKHNVQCNKWSNKHMNNVKDY